MKKEATFCGDKKPVKIEACCFCVYFVVLKLKELFLCFQNTQSGKKRDVVSADLPETSELNPSRKAKRLDHEDYSPPD